MISSRPLSCLLWCLSESFVRKSLRETSQQRLLTSGRPTHARVDNGLGPLWGCERRTERVPSQSAQWESHGSIATTSPGLLHHPPPNPPTPSPPPHPVAPLGCTNPSSRSPCCCFFPPLRVYLPKWFVILRHSCQAPHLLTRLVPLESGIWLCFG